MIPSPRCSYTCLKKEANLKIKNIASKEDINISKTWIEDSKYSESILSNVKPNPASGFVPAIE